MFPSVQTAITNTQSLRHSEHVFNMPMFSESLSSLSSGPKLVSQLIAGEHPQTPERREMSTPQPDVRKGVHSALASGTLASECLPRC